MNTLSILGAKGDIKLTWDDSNPKEVEDARKSVADLKSKGYLFFLVDGSPADEVKAGAGTLVARMITADEVVDATPTQDATDEPETAEQPKRRGGRGRKVIAARPVRGG